MPDDVPIMRVSVSLPCSAPVVPGTPETDAPLEQRTERCAVDAWWVVGRALICDHHMRAVFGDLYEEPEAPFELNDTERRPWAEMHRYNQAAADPGWGPPLNKEEAVRRITDAFTRPVF